MLGGHMIDFIRHCGTSFLVTDSRGRIRLQGLGCYGVNLRVQVAGMRLSFSRHSEARDAISRLDPTKRTGMLHQDRPFRQTNAPLWRVSASARSIAHKEYTSLETRYHTSPFKF